MCVSRILLRTMCRTSYLQSIVSQSTGFCIRNHSLLRQKFRSKRWYPFNQLNRLEGKEGDIFTRLLWMEYPNNSLDSPHYIHCPLVVDNGEQFKESYTNTYLRSRQDFYDFVSMNQRFYYYLTIMITIKILSLRRGVDICYSSRDRVTYCYQGTTLCLE